MHVAAHLFSNRSQMTSKWGENKSVAYTRGDYKLSLSLMCLLHFDDICDLLLNRCMVICNLFVLYNKELKDLDDNVSYASGLGCSPGGLSEPLPHYSLFCGQS